MITTRVGGVPGPLFQTNHVDRLLVGGGEDVYAGQKIAEISESAFPDAVEHTHYVITNTNYQALQAHPLGVFDNFADRDPQQNAPGFVDHTFPGAGQPGSVLFKRQGAGAGTYLTVDATHPLEGDVDIIVEFGDVLGTSPDQVPTSLGYWIEQPPQTCAVTYHNVQDPANAYLLFAWEQAYFGDAAGAFAVSQAISDTFWDYGSTLAGYPWPNYKHFILTNTSGTNGAAANVSAGQYWNTNAEDDGDDEVSDHANYAGLADTTQARMARFPDGVYTIHVVANDLVQDAGQFLEIPVRLENFNPIVCDINPFDGEILPPDADAVADLTVTFNEAMDMTVAPHTIMSIDNGAALQNLAWESPVTLRYDIVGMQGGQVYQLKVSGLKARDLPGMPGGRLLDGNEDGVGGDDHVITFFVPLP